jgi:polyisoprenoid-binding protein YceI
MRILLITVALLTLASCGGKPEKGETDKSEADKKENQTAEKQNYKLDAKSSTLKWKGSKSPSDGHNGSVQVTEGNIEMEGEKLISGDFIIDMTTLVAEDTSLQADKIKMLTGHLKNEDFFFVEKNPSVSVKVNGYNEGKLSAIINILGKEIKQDLPVSLTKSENGVTINGKFSLDVSTLNMPGFKPHSPEDQPILPTIDFDMNLVLNK